MPNLLLSQSLRKKYAYQQNPVLDDSIVNFVNENFHLNSHHLTNNLPRAHFNPNSEQSRKQIKIIEYLEGEKNSDAFILYIDISGFSSKIKKWNREQLSKYLDEYYNIVFPIIYKYGGEVEKVMGDGIICFFGEPYIEQKWQENENDYKLRLANNVSECSVEIIAKLYKTDKEVKIAMSGGIIKFYKMKSEKYNEYTMIGQPLTDVYRLESISENNAINFYQDELSEKNRLIKCGYEWIYECHSISPPLKGVSFEFMGFMQITNI